MTRTERLPRGQCNLQAMFLPRVYIREHFTGFWPALWVFYDSQNEGSLISVSSEPFNALFYSSSPKA